MQTILLKPLVHRGQECIGIYYANYPSLNKIIVKQVGAKWSKTHKCWYILLNKENHIKLVDALKGTAIIQQGGLYHYLTEKRAQLHQQNAEQLILPKKVQFINAVVGNEKNCISVKAITNLVKEQVKGPNQIHAINRQVLPKMQEHLILKAYSPSTIKTYLNELSQLLQKLGNIPADELNTAHLKRYFVYCFEQLKLSENTLHSRINAIKFYYEQVLGREKLFWEIPRPKKAQQLPRFFSQEDIIAIIKATSNLKHRVMLMLAYSAGLRVSEVVAMKTCNIDSGRMSILIERAKGKKDRVAGLSPALLVMLREYAKQYKPDPNGYLFGGQEKGEPYSTRSMQMVIANAKEKAGILKPGSVHALRHSFATHLLDKGTDVTIIMKLLGHNDLKTTLRYLHVTNRDILKIISPLDDLKF